LIKKKRKIVFFDFDGVIADSFSIAFEVNKMIDPLISVGTENDYRKLFDRNINDWGKNSAVAEKEVERINKEFFKRYIPQMKKVKRLMISEFYILLMLAIIFQISFKME